jgi:Tol biopolymer transport system component
MAQPKTPAGLAGRLEDRLSLTDGAGEIYVMNADGTGQTILTNSPFHDTHRLRPDGSKIALPSRSGGMVIHYGRNELPNQHHQQPSRGRPGWSPTFGIAFADRDGNKEI